jgi:LuxR family maltose regulon positive regulatory protein
LRLAAISLAQHPEPERFVAEFSGSERTVAAYLLAEVLERQPADVRELLLRTSVLDRVNGSLADYLTGAFGSERALQQLEDASAFVTSLDSGRCWFRYHKLFGELLQAELRRVAPASVNSLHRAAAQWHEQHGDIVEAIRHAQAGNDWSMAARLIADHYLGLFLDGRIPTLRELSRAFPADAPAENAELALVFATVRTFDGLLEEGAVFIDLAQRLADSVRSERRHRFDVELAFTKLSLARRRGDFDSVVEAMASMEAALAMQPASERVLGNELRATALQNLGIAELWSSRFDDARRDLEEALALARRAARPYLEIGCLGHLGIAGPPTAVSLPDGLKLAEEALAIAEERGWADDPVIAAALATGAITLVCLGRFDEAEQWLARAGDAEAPEGDPGTELIVHFARGLLRQAEGRFDDALTAFRASERMQGLLATEHAITSIVRARLLQMRAQIGELSAVRAALDDLGAEERGNAWMRVTAAVVYLAEGNPEQAVDLLKPVIEGGVPGLHQSLIVIEALILDAAAGEQLCDRRAAEASLERALELAEPEGIVLPFVLAPVHDLLEQYPRHRTKHATLLRTILDVAGGSSAPRRGDTPVLFEDLSDAELRVVRYLPSNLKSPEIAAELCLSANTVRTHIRHIYAKLDAHNRNDAVSRARELGLLARAR